MRSVPIIVAGAGASGMMAAIIAARGGKKVLLLEKKNRVGKKILATGNGKCNFTNEVQKSSCYRSETPGAVDQVLQSFGKDETLTFFHEIGIWPKERDGYYYPASGQATSVNEALYRQLQQLKVEIHTEEKVTQIYLQGKGYVVETDCNQYMTRKVILAMGGQASPAHGSEGDGYGLARSLGHHVITPLPALTSCRLDNKYTKEWTGVRIQGQVSLRDEQGNILAADQGELQLVDYGISGIPVFQISRYIARAKQEQKAVYLQVDCFPELTVEQVQQELFYRQKLQKQVPLIDALDGMLHRKLAGVWIKVCGLDPKMDMGQVPEEKIKAMARQCKQWRMKIQGVSGFEKAQVTCGGIPLEEINVETMESSISPGLYLTGELLDVDGICGGYNLQWAWSSGYLAGKAVVE